MTLLIQAGKEGEQLMGGAKYCITFGICENQRDQRENICIFACQFLFRKQESYNHYNESE